MDEDNDADELMPSSIFLAPVSPSDSFCFESLFACSSGVTIDEKLLVKKSVVVVVVVVAVFVWDWEDSIGDMLSMDDGDELDVDGNDGVLLQFNIKLN